MKEKEIFFINGMPRSGSTLLCNILAQNPDFHVTATSGLSEIVKGIHEFWKTSPIIKASESPEKQLTIIKNLFQSYHSDTDRPVVFNKSRAWAGLIELVENSLDKPIKIIATTRNISSILASMEKLYRKEIKNINSPFQSGPAMNTLEGRLNMWSASDGLVGGTYNAILDAIYRGHRDKFHFVNYENLTRNPEIAIKKVYEFLNKPYYNHNFNNVQQYTRENDAEHGFTDLHTIRPNIQPQIDDSASILGGLYNRFSDFNYEF
jgi:sulfotransferase